MRVVVSGDLELEARIGHASDAVNQSGNGLVVLVFVSDRQTSEKLRSFLPSITAQLATICWPTRRLE